MIKLKKPNILKVFTLGSFPSVPMYFGLYESCLHFLRIEDQLNTVLWKVKLVFHMKIFGLICGSVILFWKITW